MSLAITRTDLTAEDLRREARSSRKVSRRGDVWRSPLCWKVVNAMFRRKRRDAASDAERLDLPLQRDSLAGLLDRPRPGRSGLLNLDQLAEFDRIVDKGPDIETDGVVRWRRIDLKR